MTPTQIKAKTKAKQLVEKCSDLQLKIYKPEATAMLICNEVLETVRSIKGPGKISKLTFWNYVKEEIKKL